MPIRLERLTSADSGALEELRRLYAAEMGAPPIAAGDFAQELLALPHALVWGAFRESELIAFIIVFDLPEAVFAARCGMIDDLFVMPAWRQKGIARLLIEAARAHGEQAQWSHLRWLAPRSNAPANAFYGKIADRADWLSYVIPIDPRRSPIYEAEGTALGSEDR